MRMGDGAFTAENIEKHRSSLLFCLCDNALLATDCTAFGSIATLQGFCCSRPWLFRVEDDPAMFIWVTS
jgi:hypothetical protein